MPAAMMSTTLQPILRRVDHFIIRIADPDYDRLYRLFSETFALPEPWPVTQQPGFKSGGIFAGNVDFEILQVGVRDTTGHADPPEARLYGIVFESYSSFDNFEVDLEQLAQRSIPYIPNPYVIDEGGDGPRTLWKNIFIGKLLDSNLWMNLFFFYKRLISDERWMRMASSGSNNNPTAAQFMFNQVYAGGIVFTVKYAPSWRDTEAERAESSAVLESRGGGPLGLLRVKAIEIGCRDLVASQARWGNLLRPLEPDENAVWRLEDSPAIRLVQAESDGLRAMIWQVRASSAAQAWLREQGMLGRVTEDQINIAPEAVFGLDIRLVE